jgi:activator of HSP90 ATPase
MSLEFTVSDVIPCDPFNLYEAWLSSEGHANLTGSPANASDQVDGEFRAWDGYIWGRNLELEPGKRILQAWRTSEFDKSAPDSLVEIRFEPSGKETKVTIRHWNLPADGTQYQQGWIDFYFSPMKAYFQNLRE